MAAFFEPIIVDIKEIEIRGPQTIELSRMDDTGTVYHIPDYAAFQQEVRRKIDLLVDYLALGFVLAKHETKGAAIAGMSAISGKRITIDLSKPKGQVFEVESLP